MLRGLHVGCLAGQPGALHPLYLLGRRTVMRSLPNKQGSPTAWPCLRPAHLLLGRQRVSWAASREAVQHLVRIWKSTTLALPACLPDFRPERRGSQWQPRVRPVLARDLVQQHTSSASTLPSHPPTPPHHPALYVLCMARVRLTALLALLSSCLLRLLRPPHLSLPISCCLTLATLSAVGLLSSTDSCTEGIAPVQSRAGKGKRVGRCRRADTTAQKGRALAVVGECYVGTR